MKPVIVTTEHRGVFYGLADDNVSATDESIKLKDCRMAIYWGTTHGLLQLAHTGPTAKSRISAPADVEVNKITAVIDLAPEAAEAWASWA